MLQHIGTCFKLIVKILCDDAKHCIQQTTQPPKVTVTSTKTLLVTTNVQEVTIILQPDCLDTKNKSTILKPEHHVVRKIQWNPIQL